MVIDFHSHFGRNAKPLSFQKKHDVTKEQVLLAQKEAGIDYSTAIPFPAAYSEDLAELNNAVSELNHPSLLPFLWLNPYFLRSNDSRGTHETLIVAKIREAGIYGLKVHPVCDAYYPSVELLTPIFEIARVVSRPILWHTGWASFGEARFVKALAKENPDVVIVIGHMVDNNSPEIARECDNVFLETSYCSGPRRLAGVCQEIGSEKILFGTDFPVNDIVFQKTLVLRAKISDQEKENILGFNAKRLLKI